MHSSTAHQICDECYLLSVSELLGLCTSASSAMLDGGNNRRNHCVSADLVVQLIFPSLQQCIYSWDQEPFPSEISGATPCGSVGCSFFPVCHAISPANKRPFATGFVLAVYVVGACLRCSLFDRRPWNLMSAVRSPCQRHQSSYAHQSHQRLIVARAQPVNLSVCTHITDLQSCM